MRIRARGTAIEVEAEDRSSSTTTAIRWRSSANSCAAIAPRRARLPRFCGGLAGYFGYDTVRHIETKLAGQAPPAVSGLAEVPDILLVLTEELAVVTTLPARST